MADREAERRKRAEIAGFALRWGNVLLKIRNASQVNEGITLSASDVKSLMEGLRLLAPRQ